MSLTIRLVLLVLIAVLPSLGIQVWNEIDLRASREDDARNAILQIARRQTAEIDRIAEGARQFLVALAQLPQVQARDAEACGELFRRLRPQYPGYANFFATDDTGAVVCNSFGTSATAAGREYFDRAMNEGVFVVGEYVLGRATGVPSLPFAHPVRDAEGRVTGIVGASLDLDWLAARLRPQLPPDYVLSIADRNGTILVRWPNNESLRGRSFGERFRFLRDAPVEGTVEVKGFDEITYITGYVPPAASPYGLYVGVGRDKRAAFADLERATLRTMLLAGFGLALAFLAAFLGVRLLVRRPVDELSAAAQAWSAGDYGTRVGLRKAPRELAQLARTFDTMADGIARRERERDEATHALRQLNATLEERVAERTRELSSTAERLTAEVEERQRAEAALRESAARYGALFEHSPLDLTVIDVRPDGTFTYEQVNPQVARCLGIPPENMLGRTAHELFPPAMAAEAVYRYQQCVETKAPVQYELSGTAPAGDFVRSTILVPLLDLTGTVTRIFATTLDLTETRRMEEQLRQAQKMEAVGQLTGGIAHDFNNLLTVVMGNLDLLKRAPEERRPRLIENALAAVEQGRRLTGQLLAFGRKDALKPEIVDLNGLIVGMDDMLTQSLRGDIRVELDLDPALWPVEVDPAQFQIALINLAVNARDAMPKGGTFTIRTQNTVLPGEDGNEAVSITVSDTGSGIAPELLPRVFEPFFTTKEVGKGTGLGLPQVYGFTRQSGGSADIRSEIGKGTQVTLYLPRATGTVHVPSPSRPTSNSEPARRFSILVVEDNPQIAALAAEILRALGHEVRIAGDAQAALASLSDDGAPDLVFSDLVMPGDLDGFDLAQIVRRDYPRVGVLLATGYSEAASKAKADGYPLLSKPYGPGSLEVAIQRVGTYAAVERKVIPFRHDLAGRT